MSENKAFYDVQDTIDAGFNLEPMKCRHCGVIGETTYDQRIGDANCAVCGKWQLKGKMMSPEKIKLTPSEKKVLRRIRRWRQNSNQRYDFWFTYVIGKCNCCNSDCYIAVNYEGGVDLSTRLHFRNQYSIQYRKPLIKNWD